MGRAPCSSWQFALPTPGGLAVPWHIVEQLRLAHRTRGLDTGVLSLIEHQLLQSHRGSPNLDEGD